MILLPQSRYVKQDFTGLFDKNKNPIYVGDYVEAQITKDKKIYEALKQLENIAN